ncbi:MAG: hypothetical protein ACRDOE_25350, partial [Streptosporangiaceae bacterium]
EVIEQVKDFPDVISNAFAGLAAVTEDDPGAERRADEPTMAQQLRRTSLPGSAGMLRVLGGVFRELRAGDNPAEPGDITEFFKRLDPRMTAPIPTPASGSAPRRATTSSQTRRRPSCGRRTSSTW